MKKLNTPDRPGLHFACVLIGALHQDTRRSVYIFGRRRELPRHNTDKWLSRLTECELAPGYAVHLDTLEPLLVGLRRQLAHS